MNFSRRDFLKMGLAGSATMLIPFPVMAGMKAFSPSPLNRKTLPIVQGPTDESKTQFSVVHEAGTKISAQIIFSDNTTAEPDSYQEFHHPGQATSVTQFFFSRLRAGEDMKLSIQDSNRQELDRRTFRSFDPNGSFKFAICSCMDEGQHDPAIWRELAKNRPDLILFVGDSVYADYEYKKLGEASPATLWRRFSESRATLEIYHLKRLIPILAVWDDHDFGLNDTNSVEYPFVKESKENFLTFFPTNPAYCRFLDCGPGIGTAFTFGRQQIILMDDRSFRLPSGSKERYAHWGEAQEKWAIRKIREHRDATWIMNGSQFFPSVMWKESVSKNHPEQLAGFVKEIAQTRRKVLFASGDVHYSEVSRLEPELLGYETFEVTSSSIHSKSVPGFPGLVPNRRRIMSTGKRNYVLVESKNEKGEPGYHVASRSAEGEVQFELNVSF